MTPVELSELAREVIDGPHAAILATSNADGEPQSSIIFIKRDGNNVLFSTIKGRLKTRNMTRNPRVSLMILDRTDPTGRWVDIRGAVEITDDPDNTLHQEIYARFMGGATPPPEPGAERVAVRLVPEKVYQFPLDFVPVPESRSTP
jgi:PPOX class probable F420-dependent enzyme